MNQMNDALQNAQFSETLKRVMFDVDRILTRHRELPVQMGEVTWPPIDRAA